VTISLDSIPRFTPAEGLEVALKDYGLSGRVSVLPSERDQNFLIIDPEGGKFVLKIANRGDSPDLLDFQHQAMRRVANSQCDCRVQEVVPSRTGADITAIHDAAGVRHCVRLLRWIEGKVLATCTSRSASLLESIGASMAKVDMALQDFAHPAMHRVLQWDLRHAGLAQDKAVLLPRARRSRVEVAFANWGKIDWTTLRHGVIHSDANDYNVLIEGGRMSGLLDFGDMVYSATVCELAIALAYAMLHEREPLGAAAHVVRAYHRHNPLTEPEQRVLFPLILARLAASVCYSAHNRARNPDDSYQVVTEAAAWELLEQLETCSIDAALLMVREACEVPAAERDNSKASS
jgi:Ser/Thr protein kinase RdoA (MazF antagonist)